MNFEFVPCFHDLYSFDNYLMKNYSKLFMVVLQEQLKNFSKNLINVLNLSQNYQNQVKVHYKSIKAKRHVNFAQYYLDYQLKFYNCQKQNYFSHFSFFQNLFPYFQYHFSEYQPLPILLSICPFFLCNTQIKWIFIKTKDKQVKNIHLNFIFFFIFFIFFTYMHHSLLKLWIQLFDDKFFLHIFKIRKQIIIHSYHFPMINLSNYFFLLLNRLIYILFYIIRTRFSYLNFWNFIFVSRILTQFFLELLSSKTLLTSF